VLYTRHSPSPRPRASNLFSRRNHMFRNTLYVKFWLLMLLLVAVAVFLGADPWGPT